MGVGVGVDPQFVIAVMTCWFSVMGTLRSSPDLDILHSSSVMGALRSSPDFDILRSSANFSTLRWCCLFFIA